MIDALWASCGRADRRKVLLYFHGGAYLAGSPRSHRHLAAALSRESGVRVLLPDYRLAPEHRFPAALDDAFDAYAHLLNAGYQPDEIALGGDSAGGGLALALTLKLEEESLPRPACVVAFSPWTDLTGTSVSLRRNAKRDAMLLAHRLSEASEHLLGSHDRADPLVSPVFGNWSDPPPTLILASKHEILHDDAINVAERLRAAGGNVRLEIWNRVPHAWPLFQGRLLQADQAVDTAGQFLAQHLLVETEAPRDLQSAS